MSKFAPDQISSLSDEQLSVLQSQASKSPTMGQGTGSAIGDAFQGLGFMMQMHQRNEASTALQAQAQRDQAIEARISKGVTGLEKLSRSFETGPASAVRVNTMTNEYLAQFSEQEQIAVMSSFKKLTGKSLLGFVSDQEDEEDTEAKRIDDKRLQAAELSPYYDGTPIDVGSASEEQLNEFILNSSSSKATYDKKALDIQRNEKQSEKTRKMYNLDFLTGSGNSLKQSAVEVVKNIDLSDPASLSLALEGIREAQEGLITQYMKGAEGFGFPVSPSQAAEAVAPLTQSLNALKEVASGDQFIKLENVKQSHLVKQLIDGALAGEDVNQFLPFYVSVVNGLPISPEVAASGRVAMGKVIRNLGLGNSTEDTAKDIELDLEEQGIPQEKRKPILDSIKKSITSVVLGDDPSTQRIDVMYNSVYNDFAAGSDEKIVQNMGNIVNRISELAKGELPPYFTEGNKGEKLAGTLDRPVNMMFSKFSTEFKTHTGSVMSAVQGPVGTQPVAAQRPLVDLYTYDPVKGKLVQKNPEDSIKTKYPISRINTTIQNLFKAYENLGQGPERLQAQLAQAFGLPIEQPAGEQ